MPQIESDASHRQVRQNPDVRLPGRPRRRCLALIAVTALAIGPGGFFMSPAMAAICGDHADIKKILVERYKESQRAFGMVNDNGLIEVFTSNGGTWSILMTSTSGRTCVIAAGHTWQELNQALSGPAA